MDGVGGYSGWRWIFIIEGLATVVAAICAKFLIVNWPEEASFLNEHERALLIQRLSEDRGAAQMDRFDKPAIKRTFTDIKVYLGYAFTPLYYLIAY